MRNERGRYTQRHYWWDSEDNEYTLDATWHYTPDEDIRYLGEAVLLDLEVIEGDLPDWMIEPGGDVWKYIETDFNPERAQPLDDDDYPDDYLMERF